MSVFNVVVWKYPTPNWEYQDAHFSTHEPILGVEPDFSLFEIGEDGRLYFVSDNAYETKRYVSPRDLNYSGEIDLYASDSPFAPKSACNYIVTFMDGFLVGIENGEFHKLLYP